nr:hypothetical protein Itr_chr06CG10550 [Ipomoea trifida]
MPWLMSACMLGPLWINGLNAGSGSSTCWTWVKRTMAWAIKTPKRRYSSSSKARDATFSPTGWGLLGPAIPDDTQGAEDVALNASVDTLGDILMDRAYLESAANVDSVAGMCQASVPTLTEVGQDDAIATEVEEDLFDTLQQNRQHAKSSERHLPTRTSEAGACEVPQSEV